MIFHHPRLRAPRGDGAQAGTRGGTLRFALPALALCTVFATGCVAAAAGDDVDAEGNGGVDEGLTLSGAIYGGADFAGAKLALLPGKTYVGASLAPVGDKHARSIVVPSGLVVTACRTATPTLYDRRSGVGSCRRIDPAATDGGGIFSTDGGGIFSTDGGGIYSTDPGGIFSSGSPATLDPRGTLSAPAMAAAWMDSISWIQVAASG